MINKSQKIKKLSLRFVKIIPDHIEAGVLYISMEYRFSRHSCGCGCGEIIDIIFSPTDWKMIFDGSTVSITPSIGNWSYHCKSHYWITKNIIVFASKCTKEQINRNRKTDIQNKKRHYKKRGLLSKCMEFFKIHKQK